MQAFANRALFDTSLGEHLPAERVSTLVVTGCNYPNCPRATIYDASCRDYRLIGVRDAISGIQAADALQLRGIGLTVVNSDELVMELQRLEAEALL